MDATLGCALLFSTEVRDSLSLCILYVCMYLFFLSLHSPSISCALENLLYAKYIKDYIKKKKVKRKSERTKKEEECFSWDLCVYYICMFIYEIKIKKVLFICINMNRNKIERSFLFCYFFFFHSLFWDLSGERWPRQRVCRTKKKYCRSCGRIRIRREGSTKKKKNTRSYDNIREIKK